MLTPDRLRAFFDAWNAHDVETIVSYFTPEGSHFAGRVSLGADVAIRAWTLDGARRHRS